MMLENLSYGSLKTSFNSNKKLKLVTYIVAGLVTALIVYFLYRQFFWKPSNEKSQDGYWIAQNYIAKDSTDKAIAVLVPFVKKFDGKSGGELGQYLLATQYMKKGEFKKALTNLEGVSLDDTYLSIMCIGLRGDCKSEMKMYKEAAELYVEAADADNNDLTAPMYLFKAGGCAEQIKDFKLASELYTRIKNDYPQFGQQKTIDKYISRVSSNKAK
jgi:tetratricopeptide (TPR) repeat protein